MITVVERHESKFGVTTMKQFEIIIFFYSIIIYQYQGVKNSEWENFN